MSELVRTYVGERESVCVAQRSVRLLGCHTLSVLHACMDRGNMTLRHSFPTHSLTLQPYFFCFFLRPRSRYSVSECVCNQSERRERTKDIIIIRCDHSTRVLFAAIRPESAARRGAVFSAALRLVSSRLVLLSTMSLK